MKRFAALILLAMTVPAICYAQDIKEIPSSIQSPQSLANWICDEFNFHMEYPDRWQSPQETMHTKGGDCEDFAILGSSILANLGIFNNVAIVKFKDLKISHALCIWRDKDGSYSFISNQKLFRTKENRIERAIEKFYPDWESITLTDAAKQTIKKIRR